MTWVLACAVSGAPSGQSAVSNAVDGAASGVEPDAMLLSACERDTRKDAFAPGLTKQTANARVAIVAMSPAQPVKGTNTVTLAVQSLAGEPLDGVGIALQLVMPDHGHGSPAKPTVTPRGGGRYEIGNLDYAMAGLWQLSISMYSASYGIEDEAVEFLACVDG